MPAAQVVALPLMGIVPEPSWTLPQRADAIIMMMTGTSQAVPPATAPAAAPVTTPATATTPAMALVAAPAASNKAAGKRKASSSASLQARSTPPPPAIKATLRTFFKAKVVSKSLLNRAAAAAGPPGSRGRCGGAPLTEGAGSGRGGHGGCGTVGRTYSWGYSSLLWSQILAHILNVRYS